MNKLEQAARQIIVDWDSGIHLHETITALREALKPTREGKYYYKDNACTADNADSPDCICWHEEALAEQAEQEPMKECRHCGFLCTPNTNESKKWYPLKQAEQEPDYFGLTHDHTWLSIDKKQYDKLKPEGRMACYAAPVRTKDLTDDEIDALVDSACDSQMPMDMFARAVIAADREKNK